MDVPEFAIHYFFYNKYRKVNNKTHNFEGEFITASSSQYKLPFKIAQLPTS